MQYKTKLYGALVLNSIGMGIFIWGANNSYQLGQKPEALFFLIMAIGVTYSNIEYYKKLTNLSETKKDNE